MRLFYVIVFTFLVHRVHGDILRIAHTQSFNDQRFHSGANSTLTILLESDISANLLFHIKNNSVYDISFSVDRILSVSSKFIETSCFNRHSKYPITLDGSRCLRINIDFAPKNLHFKRLQGKFISALSNLEVIKVNVGNVVAETSDERKQLKNVTNNLKPTKNETKSIEISRNKRVELMNKSAENETKIEDDKKDIEKGLLRSFVRTEEMKKSEKHNENVLKDELLNDTNPNDANNTDSWQLQFTFVPKIHCASRLLGLYEACEAKFEIEDFALSASFLFNDAGYSEKIENLWKSDGNDCLILFSGEKNAYKCTDGSLNLEKNSYINFKRLRITTALDDDEKSAAFPYFSSAYSICPSDQYNSFENRILRSIRNNCARIFLIACLIFVIVASAWRRRTRRNQLNRKHYGVAVTPFSLDDYEDGGTIDDYEKSSAKKKSSPIKWDRRIY